MIQFKNCYFWRATFSWDPVPSLFPEALALLQQSVVKSGGGMSVWEPAALNLVMLPRKQFMGMGPPYISHPFLHLAGECLTQLGWWMWQRSLCPPSLHTQGKAQECGSGNGAAGQTKFWDRKAWFILLMLKPRTAWGIYESKLWNGKPLFHAVWRCIVCIWQSLWLQLLQISPASGTRMELAKLTLTPSGRGFTEVQDRQHLITALKKILATPLAC